MSSPPNGDFLPALTRKQKLHFICGEFAAIKRQLRWGVMRLAKKEALTDQYRKCLSMGFQITGWRL